MDLEKLFSKIKEINDIACNKIEEVSDSLEEITVTTHSKNFSDNERGYLRNLLNKIPLCLEAKVKSSRKLLDRHFQVLKEKQAKIKHLRNIVEKQKLLYDAKKKNLVKCRKQYEDHNEKLKGLQSRKNCIKAYKMITQTNFAYKKGSTMGYIKAEHPLNFEVFDFNHSDVSKEEITKEIWNLLENISKEDAQNMTEVRTNNNKKIILS